MPPKRTSRTSLAAGQASSSSSSQPQPPAPRGRHAARPPAPAPAPPLAPAPAPATAGFMLPPQAPWFQSPYLPHPLTAVLPPPGPGFGFLPGAPLPAAPVGFSHMQNLQFNGQGQIPQFSTQFSTPQAQSPAPALQTPTTFQAPQPTPVQRAFALEPPPLPAELCAAPALPGSAFCRARFLDASGVRSACLVPGADFCPTHRTFNLRPYVYSRERFVETLTHHPFLFFQGPNQEGVCGAGRDCSTRTWTPQQRAEAAWKLSPCPGPCASAYCLFTKTGDDGPSSCAGQRALIPLTSDNIIGCSSCADGGWPQLHAPWVFTLPSLEHRARTSSLTPRRQVHFADTSSPVSPSNTTYIKNASIKVPFTLTLPGAWPVNELDKRDRQLCNATCGKDSPLQKAYSSEAWDVILAANKTKLDLSSVPCEPDKIYDGFLDVAKGLDLLGNNKAYDEAFRECCALNALQITTVIAQARIVATREYGTALVLPYILKARDACKNISGSWRDWSPTEVVSEIYESVKDAYVKSQATAAIAQVQADLAAWKQRSPGPKPKKSSPGQKPSGQRQDSPFCRRCNAAHLYGQHIVDSDDDKKDSTKSKSKQRGDKKKQRHSDKKDKDSARPPPVKRVRRVVSSSSDSDE